MWCIHTVVLTQAQLRRNPVLSYQISIAVHAFARFMLTSLSVDKMLLLRYVNLSTNLRGLPLKVKIAPSCFKKKKKR